MTDQPEPRHPAELLAEHLRDCRNAAGAVVFDGDATATVDIPPGDHSARGDVTSGGACFLTLREVARRTAGPGLTIYKPPASHLADLVAEGFVANLLAPDVPF